MQKAMPYCCLSAFDANPFNSLGFIHKFEFKHRVANQIDAHLALQLIEIFRMSETEALRLVEHICAVFFVDPLLKTGTSQKRLDM